jgi:hypothetical protein
MSAAASIQVARQYGAEIIDVGSSAPICPTERRSIL